MLFKKIIHELKNHSPFTLTATILAVGMVFCVNYLIKINITEDVFHFFHFSHIVVSSMVSGALYYKYKKNIINALAVGLIGSIIIGSLSDVFFPYLGGSFLNIEIDFHLPIFEKTYLILFFAFLGSLIGVTFKITKYPHFIHVFLSVFASLFYMISYTNYFNLFFSVISVLIVFLSVVIPCCISDIALPLFFVEKGEKNKFLF